MKKITTLLFGLACFLTLGARAEEPTYVAQIGETDASYFTTIDEAIAAWDAGETLKLLADVTYAGTATITFGTGTYTLDTNGKTFDWTARYSAGFTIPSSSQVKVVGGGTIAFNSSSSAKDVYLTGGKFTLDGAEMVVGKSSSYGIYVNTNGSSIELKDATVTINSTNTSTLYGIYCSSKTFSGSIDNTAIVATEAVKSSTTYAVYYRPFNKTDTLTISGGKIDLSAVPEAKTTIGIYVTKGNLDIDTSVKANGNVSSIAVDESSYSYSSEYVTITGGIYIGAINSQNKVLKINGGSFSVKPAAENMVEGYIVAKNEGTGLYYVTEGEYVVSANGVPYASVEEMNSNLPDLALVKVLKSNTAVTIPEGKTVTLANAADIVIGDVVNNGTLEITDATVLAGNVTNKGTIKVINAKTDGTGIGKFSEAAKGAFKDCLGDGSFFVREENGYYTIKRYVADVDDVKYTSAKDAFEAASNSQNALITILCDIDLGTVVSNSDTLRLTGCVARQVTQEDKNTYKLNFTGNTSFYKGETVNATLDLNGKTISAIVSTGTSQVVRIECGAKLTIKDSSETGTGNIVATSESDYVGGAAVATHGGSLVIESGTIVGNALGSNDEAVALNNASAYPYPELREGVTSTEVMYGSFKMTGGTIISASNGITFNVPGGEYEISGGTITTRGSGKFGAVWVLGSASVTISNATINAPNACGINVGRGGTPKAVVQDGTIVNAKYVFALDDFIGSGCYGTLLVEGGKFDVATGGTLFNNSTAANKDTPNVIELSGGYYSVNPAESYRDYIAAGRVSSESGTWWVLERLPVAQIGETKYASLQDAMDDAVDGDTVILLKDIDVTTNTGIVVNGSTDATLDLNGHEIHGYAHANKTSYVIYNLGVLTIKDSSTEKTGKIIAEATDPDEQAVPGYASNAITNYGHLTVDGIYIYAAGEGSACYAIDNDAENAQWRSTCDKDASTKIVYLKIVNGAKLRTASSSTVRQYLDSDEIWWNVIEMDGADMGSFWLQDNYQSSTKKGYYARGILSIKNSSFIYSVNLGYYNVAGYVNVTLENSTFTSFNNNLAQYFNVYPGDVSVSNCRVQYNFTMKQPKKCLTDGIYGNAPADTLIVEGYEVQDNKDAATKEKYPFTIGLIAKVPESIITELFDAETAEKYAEGDLEAKRKVEEKLETTEANGNKAWENYVMGIKSDDILHAHAEQKHEDKIEVKLAVEAEPPANSGFTVSYAMDYTDTAANTTTLNTLDIDLDDETVDPTGIYQVKAILTPDNGGEAVVIDTQNKVGVVKATQPTEIAVIAVPWKQFIEGDHISVSNLVKTANLTPGDKLYIYEGEKYDVWALDGNRHWQQATSVSSENGEQIVKAPFGAAHEHPVGHGTGVFLERQNSSVPYYLYGEVDEGASLVTTVEEERMPIANPNLKPFDLNGYYYDADTKGWKYSIEANEGDVITIPMGKTQRKCIFKDGGWGYYQKKVENGVLKQTWVNEVKIPAGTGCWYIKNGENNVKIDWASQK